eukprot:GHVU01063711.1.p1 GENE.GHVU01063711.1~~GHVU01063711.1.p1  ORF type:complete len:417 (-),score=54.68 GHVU01063711.1:1464-2714(-)
MAHRKNVNHLKATGVVSFDLCQAASNAGAQKILSELRLARNRMLEVVSNPNNDINTLTTSAEHYFGLLDGFNNSYDPEHTGDSKLRHIVKFRWTNTLCGNTPTEVFDTVYEEISMLFNVGIWYTKHSAKLAGQEDMEEAKEVHRCLRVAAGIFSHIQDKLVGRLIEPPEQGTDLDSRVITAYINQCTAEAQEVTIARAIELKHSASIVSALAFETCKMFTTADDSLTSLEAAKVDKWRKYLQFKVAIYYAYAYNYHGENLLAQDKCGEAIKCLEESKKYFDQAEQLARVYATAKGPGTTAKPQEHLFFRKLGPVVTRTLEKCVRENGFIYHQKVPLEAPQLELKATYGLVAPEEVKNPDPSPMWSAESYKSFDITKNQPADPKQQKKESGELPPVKEADIPQSTKDPGTFSGCVVS